MPNCKIKGTKKLRYRGTKRIFLNVYCEEGTWFALTHNMHLPTGRCILWARLWFLITYILMYRELQFIPKQIKELCNCVTNIFIQEYEIRRIDLLLQ